MPRPCKNRFIAGAPTSVVYKPAGIPVSTLGWINLALDEFETIRLLDYLGYDQEKTAQLMQISRPTVTRIYASARKKIAQAITEGKAINIEGGPITINRIQAGMGPRGGRRWHGGRGRQI
jgi:predicted DNA-binding protein (UPF0251 family)